MKASHTNRSRHWLIMGAAIGALLAGTGLIEKHLNPLDATAIATVDGEIISLTQYQSYIDALQQDRRKILTQADREHVLDRMIDERLLVRQGERSALTRTEPAVRKAIVDAVIENVVSEQRGVTPTDQEITEFYEDNLQYFAHAPIVRVNRMVFRGEHAQRRAAQAHQSLQNGQTFAVVKNTIADQAIMSLPGSPVPATRLTNYLGPELTATVAALDVGTFTEPLERGDIWVILRLEEKQEGETPPLADIQPRVTRELQRRRNDETLRSYLEQLRFDSDIRRNLDLLSDNNSANTP